MKSGRWRPTCPEVKVANALILFWVGPYRLAIPATELKEIHQDSRLACLGQTEFAPERRDGESPLSVRALFQMSPKLGGCTLVLREQKLSLQVDRVERMIEAREIHNLPRAFRGEERLWFRGITLAEGSVIPILNPKALPGLRDEAA